MPIETRLALLLAYQGTNYAGWQVQAETAQSGGVCPATVQGELEAALTRITGHRLRAHGSGRTDSGVHALGQVAHVALPEQKDLEWQRALNALLPPDIRVLQASPAPDDFHARFSARGKTYTYSLWRSRRYVLPTRREFTWAVGELDEAAMTRAAGHLLGRHDFASFQNAGTEVSGTERSLTRAETLPRATEADPAQLAGGARHPLETVWVFAADGFLKQMVRNLMGALVAVGRGKLAPEDMPGLLAATDRGAAPMTAPAHGLTLAHVDYGEVDPFREVTDSVLKSP